MRQRRMHRLIAAPLLAAAVAVVPAASGQANSPKPGLRLITTLHHVDVDRFGRQRGLFIPTSIYVAATNGPFEVRAAHPHGGPLRVVQVQRDSDGVHPVRTIYPPTQVRLERGLPRFFTVKLFDRHGNLVVSRQQPFCPTADFGASRVDASGPATPHYPYYCGSPLSRAMVWGIDRGWAVPLFLGLKVRSADAPDGHYTLSVGVSYAYRQQLGMSADAATSTIGITIRTNDSPECPPRIICGHRAVQQTANSVRRAARAAAPTAAFTPGSGLPDLRALPAHDLSVQPGRGHHRDFLGFGATIWNAGPGNLVVEGFRSGNGVMAAKQFIYRSGQLPQERGIGHFEFDTREGHNHWHLSDFAQYDLLNRHRHRVVLSNKQSFCLAPTDPINLVRAGALWQPDKIGLYSACPSEESIWLRETMPAGWGDTYFQQVAGQAFDITDLPNGIYYVRVSTNPHHRIIERSTRNDVSLLKIRLGGKAGQRTVHEIGPRRA